MTQPAVDFVRRPEPRDRCAASIERGPGLILWDLVGACNLRCPSCPVGSMPDLNPKGMARLADVKRILDQLQQSLRCRQLHFYNWTEPLLHPHLAECCETAVGLGFHVHLSTNLNILRNDHRLLAAGVKTIRISLSGFTQPVYGRGHRGGNIETVKAHMHRLAAAADATGSSTRIHVYYHRYRHNLEEMAPMQALCGQLGFEFVSTWAFYTPLENVLRYIDGTLPGADRAFADELIVPPVGEAVEMMRTERHRPCELLDQLVLDYQGRVLLCCAVYDHDATSIGSIEALSWREIQEARYAHRMCGACTEIGAHVLFTHFDKPALRDRMERQAELSLREGPPLSSRDLALPLLGGATSLGA